MTMNYIDYWLYSLDDDLPIGSEALPVSGLALARLELDVGVTYALTIAAGLAQPGEAPFEIVHIVGGAGGGYTIVRGQEGTVEQNWPAGSVITAGLTAAAVAGLANGAEGPEGASAYAVAVSNGFVGTESEWLASLVGADGPAGPQGPEGPQGQTGPQGEQGEQGPAGEQGAGLVILGELAASDDLPASGGLGEGYLITGDLWVWNGAAWVNAGPIQGPVGPEGPQGIKGDVGAAGAPGASAYAVAVSNGFTGSETEWLASLAGPPGETGDSAYQVAVSNGFVGSEAEWLESLIGPEGPVGPQGPDGPQGPAGVQGEAGDPGADGNPLLGLPVRLVSGTSYMVTPADAGHMIVCTSNSPVLLTISAESAGSWLIPGVAAMFHVLAEGMGPVTVEGDGFSVLVHDDEVATLAGPVAAASAFVLGADTWRLFGKLEAA